MKTMERLLLQLLCLSPLSSRCYPKMAHGTRHAGEVTIGHERLGGWSKWMEEELVEHKAGAHTAPLSDAVVVVKRFVFYNATATLVPQQHLQYRQD